MFHHFLDVVLQNLKSLLTGPILVVLLTVATHPSGQLGMPSQTMTTHPHVVILRKPDEIIGTTVTETVARRLQGIPFHLVLCHQHVELSPDLLRLTKTRIVQVVLPHRDSRTYILAILFGIVPQRRLVGFVVNTIVIKGSYRALRNFWHNRIIWNIHLIKRH